MPPGHAQRTDQRRAFRPREKAMIGGVLGAVAVLVVALAIALATGGRSSGHGCIDVGLGYSTGGAKIDRCGEAARSFCHGVGGPGLTGSAGDAVARACRTAGIPVGGA